MIQENIAQAREILHKSRRVQYFSSEKNANQYLNYIIIDEAVTRRVWQVFCTIEEITPFFGAKPGFSIEKPSLSIRLS